jgi:hypothetical protein
MIGAMSPLALSTVCAVTACPENENMAIEAAIRKNTIATKTP